jgi:small subunit ribosomal protein S9
MNITSTSSTSCHGVGRRKSCVARVWLKRGDGSITVNGVDYKKYFDTKDNKDTVVFPLKVLSLDKNFSVDANVEGGGLVGQAGAVRLGISRALVNYDEKYKSLLKKYKLLTVDSRLKERKKYGQKAARRKFQFVKR